jgi:hypothetical protein
VATRPRAWPLDLRPRAFHGTPDDGREEHALLPQRDLPLCDAGHVEEIVHEAPELDGLPARDLQRVLAS